MNINQIRVNSEWMDGIIKLAKKNSKTLGFLPRMAFIEAARQGRLIGASSEKDELLGYIFYGVTARLNRAYIVHFCIDQKHQGQGISHELFSYLQKLTAGNIGIRVNCRRDYNLDDFWISLGFTAISEVPGRSLKGSILTVWWFDNKLPNLFSPIQLPEAEHHNRIVLDANIFFDISGLDERKRPESRALLADWLSNTVKYVLAEETLNEIARNEDPAARDKSRRTARQYEILSKGEGFDSVHGDLRILFGNPRKKSRRSDIRQLAYAISNRTTFFVTRDSEILKKEGLIYDKFNLIVIRPSDFVTRQDSLLREFAYQPVRLEGTNISIEPVTGHTDANLNMHFRAPTGETKSQFGQKIRELVSSPRTAKVSIVTLNNSPHVLCGSISTSKSGALLVKLLRMRGELSSATLARQVIKYLVDTSVASDHTFTLIEDSWLTATLEHALSDIGFSKYPNYWVKANPRFVGDRDSVLSDLAIGIQRSKYRSMLEPLIEEIAKSAQSDVPARLLAVEQQIWPGKFHDLAIPSFIIPIRPYWAQNLFHTRLADQSLFGGNSSLLFNYENVYYRSEKPSVLTAPARILWYISGEKGGRPGTKAIGAASYLDEVIIGQPKEIYRRFRRFGVFKWDDVRQLTATSKKRQLMAFRFSKTEIFESPISLRELKDIWLGTVMKNFNPICPRKISHKLYFQLYKRGMQRPHE